eukprot:4372487-Heterocapsa_arctica.AAC.1
MRQTTLDDIRLEGSNTHQDANSYADGKHQEQQMEETAIGTEAGDTLNLNEQLVSQALIIPSE